MCSSAGGWGWSSAGGRGCTEVCVGHGVGVIARGFLSKLSKRTVVVFIMFLFCKLKKNKMSF